VHAPEAPILTVGSLSKLIGPALRIGWVRAPEPIVHRLARLKAAMDLGSPLIAQAIAARLVAGTDDARRLRRRQLRPRRDHLVSELRRRLPDWKFTVPTGGLFLWITLPDGDAREFAQVALRHGVVIVPGPDMSADEQHSRHIRITYLWDEVSLTTGVVRLAAAWRSYRSSKPRPREPAVIV
jgi:DNA-binding transcriptional MocR family regulator